MFTVFGTPHSARQSKEMIVNKPEPALPLVDIVRNLHEYI